MRKADPPERITLERFIEILEHPILACVFLIFLLTVSYYFFGRIWEYLLTAFLTYIIADILCKLSIRGGEGIFQVRILGTDTLPRGHALLVFASVIIIATYLSAGTSLFVIDSIQNERIELLNILAINACVVGAALLDMLVNYYDKD